MQNIIDCIIVSIVFILLTGCSTTQTPQINAEVNATRISEIEKLHDNNASQMVSLNLQEVQWQVIGINGKAIMVKEAKPYIKLKFDNHRLQGFGGCNLLFGSYTLEADATVHFPMVASTKRACQNRALEDEFLKMLSVVDTYAIEEGVLVFFNTLHQRIATFEALN